MGFIGFMRTGAGRAARIVAGLLLAGTGLLALRGPAGAVLAVLGALMIAAGAFNFCLLAPLFHQPLRTTPARH